MGAATSITTRDGQLNRLACFCHRIDLQVCAILTLLRLGSTVVAVGSLVEATNLGELAGTTGVQGDHVLALVVDSFDDVDLANRVLVKVV
jgi:hypothetical protein